MWQREGLGMGSAAGAEPTSRPGQEEPRGVGRALLGRGSPSDRSAEEKNKVWALAAKVTSGGLAGSDGAAAEGAGAAGGPRGEGDAPRAEPPRENNPKTRQRGNNNELFPARAPASHLPSG